MMKAACWRVLFAFMLASLLMTGCMSIPCVVVYHSPVIAKSSETVTFTATVCNKGAGPGTVQILVNAALAQTCNNVGTGGTCTYTGGPYAAYQGTTVAIW